MQMHFHQLIMVLLEVTIRQAVVVAISPTTEHQNRNLVAFTLHTHELQSPVSAEQVLLVDTQRRHRHSLHQSSLG
ncbi:hypothetical protein D3C78_1156550 [compost metagenome]